MITTLLSCLVLTVFLQPNAPRMFAASCFVLLVVAQDLAFGSATGLEYYGTAALADLTIILLTSGISPVPKMVLTLHKICMASVLVNFAGWLMWYFYLMPIVYDVTIAALYVWALFTFFKRDGLNDSGGFRLTTWLSCFRYGRRTWASYHYRDGGKI